ncbi:large conductance mechanosensitive channel [Gemmobacter aquatilis]|uniref:Large-conductance mechanosensitive channel n=1 Tax=Gemmobacter aquatilis TaxID=933059 RepID=A0A1H8KE80_9RHOB|nr:large conductance mechanosensitive channel protein MscL [Gemmobacter aquatilis]SEN90846.1 large conductance mechanosensitive channel [Gemmobacter aquatilis]
MLNEFKAFIARGNVVDLAVGIIIGAAFTAIVTSLVSDLINPLIGVVTGGVDFSNLFFNLNFSDETVYPSLAAAKEAGAPVFAYGAFLTACINFLIVAWVVFLIVKAVNTLKETMAKKEEAAAAAAPAGPTELEVLLQIRDALQK